MYENFSACICVHLMHAMPEKAKRKVGFPGTSVIHDYEPLYGLWKLNLGPVQGH